MNTLIQNYINNKFSRTPIWLMRQAGRYLPEFRSIRDKNQDFIKLCLNTKLSTEITIQPITRFDFDAANKQFTSRFALNPSLFNRPPQTVGFTPFSSFRPFNT